MSSQKIAEISLQGTIPSKKNSRINTSSGMSYPSTKFTQWQDDAITETRRQTRARFAKPVSIEVIIYFATLGKADIDNKLTSILDMLAECVVIPDDKWHNVPIMKVQAEYRQRKPGAFVRIEELPDDFFSEEYHIAKAKLDSRNRR